MNSVLALLCLTGPTAVSVSVDSTKILNRISPIKAFGGAVDGEDKGEVLAKLRPSNVAAMKKTGLRPLSYRLRTELGDEAWHWNPEGSWSDSAQKQGYWTSSSQPGAPISLSWGYRLPRRGNTVDQANDDGYSRIDDGDDRTYWKSNPYLDQKYTGEPEKLHPQWVIVDFEDATAVNAIKIQWANPYAVKFRIQYWTGKAKEEPEDSPVGQWVTFPNGAISSGHGKTEFLNLGPVKSTRYVRVQLLESSRTAEPSAHPDPRDRFGFTMRELDLGTLKNGHYESAMVHKRTKDQTHVYVSSTDPWHRASDRDPGIEQPGLDLIYHRGLDNRLPVLVPFGLIYDTPENAEAEIRWLKARGYSLQGAELGEEPDGQYAAPEDFASLYLQIARRIRAVEPNLPIGGPSLQTIEGDGTAWSDDKGDWSWISLFLGKLQQTHNLDLFQFFSFEWYPFDDPNESTQPQVLSAAAKFAGYTRRMRDEGVPTSVPWIITEYGYSAFSGPAEVQIPAALVNLDSMGTFYSLGGAQSFLYGYEPNEMVSDVPKSWGNLMTWLIDDDGDAHYPMPTYWSSRMMSVDWCQPGSGEHQVLDTSSSDQKWIGAYSVKRPDGSIAVLLVNRSDSVARRVSFSLDGRAVIGGEIKTWGAEEYEWKKVGAKGHPTRSLPPKSSRFTDSITLPAYSAAVVTLR